MHEIEDRRIEAGLGEIKLINNGTGALVNDAQLKVCTYFDIDCDHPLSAHDGANEEDIYAFSLPDDFDGYLEVTRAGLIPTLIRISPHAPFHYIRAVREIEPVPMVSPSLLNAIEILAGKSPKPDTAILFGAMVDCEVNYAADMRASLKPEAADGIFYLKNSQYPDLKATATDSSGLWGAINLEPGFAEALAHRESDGGFVGKAGFVLRAGYVTVVSVGPSPE